MDDFELELKEDFLEEAQQSLDECEGAFLELERTPDSEDLLNQIFRLAHNLKGTSRAVGFGEVAEFTHHMEDLILKVKEGEISASDDIISTLLECSDHLREMISGLKENIDASFDSQSLVDKIEACLNGEVAQSGVEEEPENPSEESAEQAIETDSPPVFEEISGSEVSDSEREDMDAANSGFSEGQFVEFDIHQSTDQEPSAKEVSNKEEPTDEQSSPFETPDLAASEEDRLALIEALQSASDNPEASEEPATPMSVEPASAAAEESLPPGKAETTSAKSTSQKSPKKTERKKSMADESIRVSLQRLDQLNNFVGELVILQNVLSQNQRNMDPEVMAKSLGQLGKISKEIHEITMSLRMLPIRPTVMKMQRIVRDTSKMLDKKVNLVIEGEETEVDKTILESLDDPLVHIVRNAIDHGLESSEDRVKSGKASEGTIWIRCFYEGNNIAIEVRDDGKGIDPQVIRQKAIEKKVIDHNAHYNDEEIIQFIFDSGFSTKASVSEVSGRGVGMDVVKTNIQLLSGEVRVDSQLGQGTSFKILLPLTMAIIEGLIARVGTQSYVLPLSQVHEMIKICPEDIDFCSGVGELINLRGDTIPLFRLRRILGQKSTDGDLDERLAVIVKKGKDICGIAVDDILHQQQIVVKKLGEEVVDEQGYMGGSILGDGQPALILDLFEIASEGKRKIATAKNQLAQKKKNIPPTMEAAS